MNSVSRVLLPVAMLISSLAMAADEYSVEKLTNLFKQYERAQAYSYASQYLSEQEGDPYFDYYYGVSAIDTGHASQGVFALERVLLAFPQDQVARLELARGYFVLEEYSRSRQEFEAVLANDPPLSVQQNAQVYLDQIRLKEARYKTTSNGYLEIGVGSDSNVNSAPDQDASISGILNRDSTGQDDMYSSLAASYQITHPFSPGWTFNTSITGDYKKNADLSQFDSLSATLQLGLSALHNQSKYSVDAVAQQYNLDGSSYRTLTGMTFGWRYSLSQKSSINTSVQYAALDFDTAPGLNSTLMILNLGYSHQFVSSLSPVLFAGLKYGTEDPEFSDAAAVADVERSITGARIGVVLSLMRRLAMQTSIATQVSEYGGKQSFPPVTREDTFNTVDMNFLWLVSNDWRLDTRLAYSKNESNLAIRDYDRTRISLNLNYAY